MKQLILSILIFLLSTIVIEGCGNSNSTSVLPPSCTFTKTIVMSDSLSNYPMTSDSSRIYFWHVEMRNSRIIFFDSLMDALCELGYSIEEAWYPLHNKCANPLPLDPYIILRKADSTILQHGLRKGANNPLSCSDSIYHYTPQ